MHTASLSLNLKSLAPASYAKVEWNKHAVPPSNRCNESPGFVPPSSEFWLGSTDSFLRNLGYRSLCIILHLQATIIRYRLATVRLRPFGHLTSSLLSYENIWRSPGKTLLTVAVGIAVVHETRWLPTQLDQRSPTNHAQDVAIPLFDLPFLSTQAPSLRIKSLRRSQRVLDILE